MLALATPALFFEGHLPAVGDVILFNYPAAAFSHVAWARGQIPFWNPYASSGSPFLADPIFGALYPVSVILSSLLSAEPALAWYLIVHLFLGYIGTYLYARSVGISRVGAVFGATSYALGGYVMIRIVWPNVLASHTLLPFALFFLERALQAKSRMNAVRWAGGAGVILALSALAGVQQFAYFISLAVGGRILFRMLVGAREGSRQIAWSNLLLCVFVGGCIAVIAVGLFAIQLLPTATFLTETRPLTDFSERGVVSGLQLSDLARMAWGRASSMTVDTYLGAATIPLALCAFGLRRSCSVAFLSTLTVVTLGLSARLPEWVYSSLNVVPTLRLFHSELPERILLLPVFSVCVLAGHGMDGLFCCSYSISRKRIIFAVATLLFVVALGIPVFAGLLSVADNLVFLSFLVLNLALVSMFLAVVRDAHLVQIVLIGVLIADLTVAFRTTGLTGTSPPFSNLSQYFETSQVSATLLKLTRVESARVIGLDPSQPYAGYYAVPEGTQLIAGNSAWVYGLRDTQSYNPLQLRRYFDYVRALNGGAMSESHLASTENVASSLARYLNVRYLVTPSSLNSYHETVVSNFQLTSSQPHLRSAVPDLLPIDNLTIVSVLASSASVAQGDAVGKIVAETDVGESEWTIRAGIDTAEWAHDRPDILGVIKHQLAPVAAAADDPQGYKTYTFQSILKLDHPRIIKSFRFDYVANSAAPLFSWVVFRVYTDRRINTVATPMEAHGDYQIWQLRDRLPRVMLVPTIEIIPDDKLVLARLQQFGFDPRHRAILDGDPPAGLAVVQPGSADGPAPSSARETITRDDFNELDVQTDSTAPEMLIVSENYYPDWRAQIDGKPSKLYRVNYTFQGVAVPAGRHTVRIFYDDTSFKLGALISISTLIVLVILIVSPILNRRIRSSVDASGKS